MIKKKKLKQFRSIFRLEGEIYIYTLRPLNLQEIAIHFV